MGASLDASCVLQYGYCVNVPVVVDHEGNDRAVAINIHIAEDDRDVLWCFDAMRKMMPGWAAINTLVIADESEPVILSPCSSDWLIGATVCTAGLPVHCFLTCHT